jgi:hypothetical protein
MVDLGARVKVPKMVSCSKFRYGFRADCAMVGDAKLFILLRFWQKKKKRKTFKTADIPIPPFLSKGTLLLFSHEGHSVPGLLWENLKPQNGREKTVTFSPLSLPVDLRPRRAGQGPELLQCKLGETAVPGLAVAIPQVTMEFALTAKGAATPVLAAWSALLEGIAAKVPFVVGQLRRADERSAELEARTRKQGSEDGEIELEEEARLIKEAVVVQQHHSQPAGFKSKKKPTSTKPTTTTTTTTTTSNLRRGRSKASAPAPLLETEVIQIGDLSIAGDMDINQEIIDHANMTCVLPRGAKVKRQKFM